MAFDAITAAEVAAWKPVTGKLMTKCKNRLMAVADRGMFLAWTEQSHAETTTTYGYATFPLFVPKWMKSGTSVEIALPLRCQVSGSGGTGSGYTGSFKIGFGSDESGEVNINTALGTSKNSGFTFTLTIPIASLTANDETILIRLYSKVTSANGTTTATVTHNWVGAGSGYSLEVNALSTMKRVA